MDTFQFDPHLHRYCHIFSLHFGPVYGRSALLAGAIEQAGHDRRVVRVRHLERYEPNEKQTSIAARVRELAGEVRKEPLYKPYLPALIIDASFMGRGAMEALKDPAFFSWVSAVSFDPGGYGAHLRKDQLVADTRVAIERGELSIVRGLAGGDKLVKQLESYDPRGALSDPWGWQEGDDLVTTLTLVHRCALEILWDVTP